LIRVTAFAISRRGSVNQRRDQLSLTSCGRSCAQSCALVASGGVLRIGGNSVRGEWFKGYIDEVRIYKRTLSASEIVSDMNNPVVP